jgi:hypothetical protein
MNDKSWEVHHHDINTDPNKQMIYFGGWGNLSISNDCNVN